MSQSSSPAGKLQIVSTPIGNLQDVTLRALAALRTADVVAAEDTRVTRILLAAHGISARLLSFHEHNCRRRTGQILQLLAEGRTVALVSDAGTPTLSDPGLPLVRAAIAAGAAIEIIPGPSAILHALAGSGASLDRFTYLGFPPRTPGARARWLAAAAARGETCVFFESAHRITRTLAALAEVAPQRYLCVARELTKRFEEWTRGPAAAVAEELARRPPRGEYTLVLGASGDSLPGSAGAGTAPPGEVGGGPVRGAGGCQ